MDEQPPKPTAAPDREWNDEEVYDGWATWRVKIETKLRRGRQVYRYVVERKFVRWDVWRRGWWTRDIDKAMQRGKAVLDSKRRDRYEEVGYL